MLSLSAGMCVMIATAGKSSKPLLHCGRPFEPARLGHLFARLARNRLDDLLNLVIRLVK